MPCKHLRKYYPLEHIFARTFGDTYDNTYGICKHQTSNGSPCRFRYTTSCEVLERERRAEEAKRKENPNGPIV